MQPTSPVPMPKHDPTVRVSALSRRGLTLDSYIIVDGQSISIRHLREAGLLTPRAFLRSDGYVYEALFTDRPRSIIIHKETYDTMMGFQAGDADAKPDLSIIEQVAVDAAATPEKVDAIKMIEHGPWENEVVE